MPLTAKHEEARVRALVYGLHSMTESRRDWTVEADLASERSTQPMPHLLSSHHSPCPPDAVLVKVNGSDGDVRFLRKPSPVPCLSRESCCAIFNSQHMVRFRFASSQIHYTARFSVTYSYTARVSVRLPLHSTHAHDDPRLAQADRVPAHTFIAARSQVGPH